MQKIKAVLSLILVTIVSAQNFSVSLSYPSLIDNNYTNINAVGKDSQNNFLVSLQNSQARRYSPGFTSYSNFTLQEPADAVSGIQNTIMNGTAQLSNSNIIYTLSKNRTTLRTYHGSTFSLLETYEFNETINSFEVFSFNTSGTVRTFFFIFCPSSIKFAFASVVTTMTPDFYANLANYDVWMTSYNPTCNAACSVYYLNLQYYLMQSASTIYFGNFQVIYNFNSTTRQFNFGSKSKSLNRVVILPFQPTTIMFSNSILLFQDNSTGNWGAYDTVAKNLVAVNNISSSPVAKKWFTVFNKLYLLQSTALTEISITTTSVSSVNVSASLPSQAYSLVQGSVFDIFYVVGKPYIYKAGACIGQNISVGSSCQAYLCTVTDCMSCPAAPATCGVCNAGYYLTPNMTCSLLSNNSSNSSYLSSNSSSNTNNSLINNQSNTTLINNSNSSNTYQNNSNLTNIPNINTTLNNNSNSSNTYQNNSNLTNTPNLNVSNSTYGSYSYNTNFSALNQTNVFYSSDFILFLSEDFYQMLMKLLLFFQNVIQTVISVPGARRVISPLFYYFGIFDDIYFYQFQDRFYGVTMTAVFNRLNQIQNAKWGLIGYEKVLTFFNLNKTKFDQTLDYQSTYLTFNFSVKDHAYLGTESFFGNCQNFVICGLPMIIIGFAIGHISFKALFFHPISKIIRKFDFCLFVLLLVYDGNVQQFTFYLTRDLTNIFVFGFLQKFIKIAIIYFSFVVIAYSCAMFLVCSILYKRLRYYFTDNNRNSLGGIIFLIVQYGFKNMMIGASQALLRQFSLNGGLYVLLSIQMGYFIIFIVSAGISIYKLNTKIWIFIILNLIKIMLIFTFLWEDDDNQNMYLVECIQQGLLFCQIFVFLLGVIYESANLIKDLVQIFIKMYRARIKTTKLKVFEGKTQKYNNQYQKQQNQFKETYQTCTFMTKNKHFKQTIVNQITITQSKLHKEPDINKVKTGKLIYNIISYGNGLDVKSKKIKLKNNSK